MEEYSRQYLGIRTEQRLDHEAVLETLEDMFLKHNPPEHVLSENGSKFTALALWQWLERRGLKTQFIEPCSSLENGYSESFKGRLRDEFLNVEVFYTHVKTSPFDLKSS